VAKGEALLDAVFVRVMDGGGAGQAATALWILGLQQVTLARPRAQDLSAGSDLKALGSGFLGFDAFWTSHKLKQIF